MTVEKALPVDKGFTLILMNELREEKHKKFDVQVVKDFPKLSELTHDTFLGSFAWTSRAGGYKLIKQKYAHSFGAGWVTPADLARDYLTVKYGTKPLRCNSRQYQALVKNRKSQPIYAEPMKFGNASYLDLKSAYWQILQVGGWDVDYCPNRYLSPRSDVSDFPVPFVKLARNALVSNCLPVKANMWSPAKGIVSLSPHKPSVNLVLWGFVMDVLHDIANDMIEYAEAIYVNTDGYIIPDYRLKRAFEVQEAWGVYMTVRHSGAGEVRGAGDYDIGNRSSLRIRTSPRPYRKIQPTGSNWLREKFYHWSNRIQLDFDSTDVLLQTFTR